MQDREMWSQWEWNADEGNRTVDAPPRMNEGVGEKQVGSEAGGRARLHPAEGNREFDLERQAGREERTAASEGDARSED